MVKPKVKILDDDGRKQVIQLMHPDKGKEFVCVVHHVYDGVDSRKIDVIDEAAVMKLWKDQLKRASIAVRI